MLLTTSLKVMYSTLRFHRHLEEISELEAARLQICRCVDRHVMLVRDPYDRLVSTWADKFGKHPRGLGGPEFGGWQRVQRLYLRRLGFSTEAGDDEIKKFLLSVEFSTFMTHVPSLYWRDGHLHPQYWAKSVRLKGPVRGFRLPISRFIRVEEMNAEELLENFGVDVRIRCNATHHPPACELFTPEYRSLAHRIYEQDFNEFGYDAEIRECELSRG